MPSTASAYSVETSVLPSMFLKVIKHDDGQAAKQHLAAGRPIYYGDMRYPGKLVKKFPDGRKQLVLIDLTGKIEILQDI